LAITDCNPFDQDLGGGLMGLFDEPILIDGKDVSYKRPKDAKPLDIHKFFKPYKKSEDAGS
jgi:hypothetical protein